MVRKRSRKYYESDENDTDSDYADENFDEEPAPKKYSLRQRKRTIFAEDFEYDIDDEDAVPPPKSDDEDFELEVGEAPDSDFVTTSTYINHYEPEIDSVPENDEGLIDFEDVIRADIVVNKNRIDYDNLIQKTEIKVQQPTPKKRGRKPKVKEADNTPSVHEPEMVVSEGFGTVETGEESREQFPSEELIEAEFVETTNNSMADSVKILTNVDSESLVDSNKGLPSPEIKGDGVDVPTTKTESEDTNDEQVDKVLQEGTSPSKLLDSTEVIPPEEKSLDDVILLEDNFQNNEVIVLDD